MAPAMAIFHYHVCKRKCSKNQVSKNARKIKLIKLEITVYSYSKKIKQQKQRSYNTRTDVRPHNVITSIKHKIKQHSYNTRTDVRPHNVITSIKHKIKQHSYNTRTDIRPHNVITSIKHKTKQHSYNTRTDVRPHNVIASIKHKIKIIDF